MTISSLQGHRQALPATRAIWHRYHSDHEHTRSHRSVFSQMGNGQCKDSSPHDGMKQTYCREQPRIIQKNSQQSKYSCRYRSNRQLHAGRNPAQAAPHQAAHKHTTPIERSHQCRRSIIHLDGIQIDIGPDTDFHSYIKEDSHHAQCQMTEGPYTFFQLFSLLYLVPWISGKDNFINNNTIKEITAINTRNGTISWSI